MPRPNGRSDASLRGLLPSSLGDLGSAAAQTNGGAVDALDDADQEINDNFVHTQNDVNEVERPWGNSAPYAHRRLHKHRPDLHARVLVGELTANAAMIEAGFRKPAKRRIVTM